MSQKKTSSYSIGTSRGVIGARRPLSPDSYQLVNEIKERLAPECVNAVRLWEVNGMGVTIVGASRFTPELNISGPSTRQQVEQIETSTSPIDAKITAIGFFGSIAKAKLALMLESPTLYEEQAQLESLYAQAGFPLDTVAGGYKPHLSLGTITTEHVGYFQEEITLSRLGRLAAAKDLQIVLRPIEYESAPMKRS